MKKMLLILAISASVNTHAQVLVGTATSTINSSAQLEVSSTSKGFLPPRMTRTELNAIASPTPGLLVYCTDCGPKGKVQIYNGVTWINPDGTSSELNLPSVTTFPIGDTTITNANSGAVVTNTGGSNILFKGVCWSTHKNPTLADSARIGNDSLLILHSLQPNTTYYVRAVAASAVGIAYGNQLEFKTKKLSLYDHYAGGIVFYLWEVDNVQHGYVVSEKDIYFNMNPPTYHDWKSMSSNYRGYGYTDWGDLITIINFSSGVQIDAINDILILPGFYYALPDNSESTPSLFDGPFTGAGYVNSYNISSGNNYLGSNYIIGNGSFMESRYGKLNRGYSEKGFGLFEGGYIEDNTGLTSYRYCYFTSSLGHLRAFRSF